MCKVSCWHKSVESEFLKFAKIDFSAPTTNRIRLKCSILPARSQVMLLKLYTCFYRNKRNRCFLKGYHETEGDPTF